MGLRAAWAALVGPTVLRQSVARAGRAGAVVLVGQVLGLIATLVVSRALGPERYGRFGLALVFSIYTFHALQWGLHPLLTLAIVRGGRTAAATELAVFVRLRQAAALAVVAACAVIALAWPVPGEWPLLALGVVDGYVLALTVPSAFDPVGRQGTWAAVNAARLAIYLVVVATIVKLWPHAFTPVVVMAVHAAAVVPPLVAEWRWILRTWGPLDFASARGRPAAAWVAAAPVGLADFAAWALMYLGAPSMEWSGHGPHVGPLVASNQVAVSACVFAVIATQVVHAQLASVDDPFGRAFRRGVASSLAVTVGTAIVGALVLSVSSRLLVPLLFGRGYAVAVPLLAVDAWRLVAVVASGVLGSALICQRRTRAHAAFHVVGLGVGAVCASVLVPRHGAMGAVVAVLVGRAVHPALAGLALLSGSKTGSPPAAARA